jgi:hypothetical protein
MKLSGEQLLKRFKKAKSGRDSWVDMWQDIYDLTLPSREGFYATVAGEERSEEIFDETALVSLSEFNSGMQEAMIPTFQQWFRFEPGIEIVDAKDRKKLQGELDEVSGFVWDAIGNSNFYNEAQELTTDLAVGWGTQSIEDGRDGELIAFKTIPQSHCYWDTGPFKQVDGMFRVREKVKIVDIKTIWPDAKVSDSLAGKAISNPNAETALVEASYRNWDEVGKLAYHYQVVAAEDKSLVIDDEMEGLGSRPFVTPRWMMAAGEVYGRGPLVQVLPAIRTANMVQEMILENAQMSISGIWQVDDDGNINVDNVEIVPGAVYARPADSRGLERTDSGANFNVADFVLADMKENIRKALFAENFGPVDQTPRSATEINARMQNLAKQIGGPYSRLQFEWLTPMLQRVIFLLTRQGKLEMPTLDGRQVRVVAKSPLARAQKFEEVERIRGFAGDVIGILGPQAGQLAIDPEVLLDELSKNWEMRADMVRSVEEQQRILGQVTDAAQEAQQEQQAGGGGQPALAAV